jgi:hypothetical protein
MRKHEFEKTVINDESGMAYSGNVCKNCNIIRTPTNKDKSCSLVETDGGFFYVTASTLTRKQAQLLIADLNVLLYK